MKRNHMRLIFALLFLIPALAVSGLSQTKIISPKEFLGFDIGQDRKLADWSQIQNYYAILGRSSDRIQVVELGKTTEGRPFIMAVISSPENLRNLAHYQALQKRLADPRSFSAQEAGKIIGEGKVIVLLTCNIHSTEVASAQTSLEFAYRMATENSDRVREILDQVILLHVPSLNPDGQDMVVKWYQKYVDTPYEGAPPPFLYHKYVGHDNNRDWYMFTQVETRLAIEKIHNAWHPQIVYDVHQMETNTARMFVPPWIDPIEPNIDPILVQEMNFLGSSMAVDLTAEGKKGVVTNALYDLWAPARHYQCYHGGLRILTESASARLATPIEIPFDKLEGRRGFDPKARTWNFPDPWPGGEWRLRDIVDYQLSAFFSLLSTAARHRDRFLRNFYLVGKKAVERKEPPYAFIIPADQRDPPTTAKMLNVLRFGLVEVHRAKAAFTADETSYPAGSYVIPLAQPYGAFAKALLERQSYPDLREYAGGPPKRPYDVTAHTLPLLMGVRAVRIDKPFTAPLERVDKIEPPPGEVVGGNYEFGYLIGPETNDSIVAINRLLKQGHKVYRAAEPIRQAGRTFPAGAVFVPSSTGLDDFIKNLARDLSLKIYAAESKVRTALYELRPLRVGLYKSYVPSMDEGWTRWVFEQFEIPYETLLNKDMRSGKLSDRFDAIVIPDMSASTIVNGTRGGRRGSSAEGTVPMPPEFTGGIREEGVKNLKRFIEAGGALIALNNASNFPIERFDLAVKNTLLGLSDREFYCPGSILKAELDTRHPIAYGLEKETIAWFENGPAFEVGSNAVAVAKYPAENPLLSGWLLGERHLFNRSAIVDVPMGKGRVILLGFRAQYRGQAHATYRLLFNALYYAAGRKVVF